jgi:sigma-B regulation protein RsbU (phosphoserine phosphatase)
VKILVAWDDPKESELLQLYLALGDNIVTVCSSREEVCAQAAEEAWDVVFMSETFPATVEEGFAAFLEVRQLLPDTPVVLGCRPDEMIGLPRFLKMGLRSYVIRDERGDFIFLVLANIESTVAAVQAERTSALATLLREEMDGVRKLQETIIPRGIQSQRGYRTVAKYEPSEVSVAGGRPVVMAGGDYYEVFPVDQKTLVALVGDASGHGLKACMSIITMHTLIRMISQERYRDTAAFVTEINKRLSENVVVQSGGGFITLFYASIDIETHTMDWTSAGHPLALIHDRKSDEVYPVGTNADGGLPLGITAEMGYESAATVLPPGCRVLIYSDGLTDALAPGGGEYAMFGVKGIAETLQACRHCTLEETMDRLFTGSRTFTAGEGRHDDTSLVLVERTG